MSAEPLDIIQQIIEANSSITSLLGSTASGDGKVYPNVAQEDVPDDMERPYIVLRLESDGMEQNDLLGSALVSADIFTEGDRTLARQIARNLERAVHNKAYTLGNEQVTGEAVQTFRRFKYEPPQPDPSVKCVNVKIFLRYYRDDLLE
ncbi:hypothetical protein [Bacillus sp. PK3_68]|uniref:hypothetical protein n=1 Tax=Bacillus sp. PK3_68 TaxID=2027408 RepID=UPI000E72072E|nr:hypothetical protein [Bacillus sp. PK3_68]RJS60116.1 hypothetical protein CJ483_08610 [Bacillus sp. PK3_68]